MPLFPMYFSPLSPQQANPMLTGMQEGATIAGTQLGNIGRGIQNSLLQAQVPYAGQMAQAKAQLAQAQVPLTESQAALNFGTIPYLGYKYISPYLAAKASEIKANVANTNLFRNLIQTPYGQQIMQNNPTAARTFLNAIQNSSDIINNRYGLDMPSVAAPGTPTPAPSPFQGTPVSTPLSGATTPAMMTYQNPANYPMLPGGNPNTPVQPGQTLTPQQTQQLANLMQPGQQNISAIQQAARDAYAKQMTPQPVLQQRYYEQSVNNMLAQAAPIMPDVASFAGMAGHAGKAADAFAQSAGLASSPQYRNFKTFTDIQAPIIANELRRAFGAQATDAESKMMRDIANPVAWNKDPQQVLMEFNALHNALSANAGAISQTPGQVTTATQQEAAAPASSAQNMAAVQMPTFANKQQFQSWYSALPPAQQVAVRQQLGGK